MTEIHRRQNSYNHGYKRSKQSPEYWLDMLEEDPGFDEDFKRVFNNYYIQEEDYFIPEVLEDTYADMEIALPRYEEGP